MAAAIPNTAPTTGTLEACLPASTAASAALALAFFFVKTNSAAFNVNK